MEEEEKKKKKKKRREEEVVETALAAAGAALLVSGLKKLLPFILSVAPSPLLFLLLHLIIASIVIISTQPDIEFKKGRHHSRKKRNGKSRKRWSTLGSKVEEKKSTGGRGDDEEGDLEEGDADELNARVEAFIAAFRNQLRLDSFASRRFPRGNRNGTSSFY